MGSHAAGRSPGGEPPGRDASERASADELLARVAALPKVLLHDHLDGGLRPATVLDLADGIGHRLPAGDPDALADWFLESSSAGSLERYLETFAHTLAVMQTADGLHRVAREAVLDLAADGVVHAELRYAPTQHLTRGLAPDEVVEAVHAGLADGVAAAAADGRTIRVGALLVAMRQQRDSADVARLALAHRDTANAGVLGFDIAGPEAGFPPAAHAAAFRTLRRASFPVTVHAGEADGVASIAQALHVAGATRLGHGVRIADDIAGLDGDAPVLGDVAHWVRDRRVPLEVCPSSNVQTGAAASIATHPVTGLLRHGFTVTLSTDNRLQSATSVSREMALLVEHAGWTLDDLRDVTVAAAQNAFIHADERTRLVRDVIAPAYRATAGGKHRA